MVAWTRLPGLLRHMYNRKILKEIGELIERVAKLDFNTHNGVRGKFARMAVFVDLRKPLISQIFVNGNLQRIEHENLSVVCFACGRYGHNQDIFPNIGNNPGKLKGSNKIDMPTSEQRPLQGLKNQDQEGKKFDPWMLVERKQRRGTKEYKNGGGTNKKGNQGKSGFLVLEGLNEDLGLEEIGPACLGPVNINKNQVQEEGNRLDLGITLGGMDLPRSGKKQVGHSHMRKTNEGKEEWASIHLASNKHETKKGLPK